MKYGLPITFIRIATVFLRCVNVMISLLENNGENDRTIRFNQNHYNIFIILWSARWTTLYWYIIYISQKRFILSL